MLGFLACSKSGYTERFRQGGNYKFRYLIVKVANT